MKRAFVLVLVVLAAALVVWRIGGSDAPQPVQHDPLVPRLGEATDSAERTALVDADLARSDAPTHSAPDDTRAALSAQVQPSEASTLVGRTIADLVVLREGLGGPLVRDYEVLSIASNGASRTLRSTDSVEVGDVAPDGVWVLLLAGACPRFVDPLAVARGVAAADGVPLELLVMPSARLVVRLQQTPSGAAPIQRVALHAEPRIPLPRAWRVVHKPASHSYEEFLPHGRALRSLSDREAMDEERAAAVLTVRSSAAFNEVAADLSPSAFGFLLPWIARAESVSESVTFEHVPSIAVAHLSLVVECADALDHDGEAAIGHRQRQEVGGCALTNLVLEPGEIRVVNVHYVVHGLVRGVFPIDAREPFHLELWIVDSTKSRVTSSFGRFVRPPENGGAFQIDAVVPGRYRFAASWHDEAGERRWFESQFDMAPAAVHDFGTLLAASASTELVLRLSVDRATREAGVEIDVDGLACLMCVVSSDRISHPEGERFVWIANGEVVRLEGLPVGGLAVSVMAVVPREVTAEAAHDFANRHGIERSTQRPLVVGFGVTASGRHHFTTKVPSESAAELAVEVAAVGSVAAQVFVPAEFVRQNAQTLIWFVRGEGTDVTQHQFREWRGVPTGGGFLSGTFVLPVGEWTAFVRLTLPPTADEPRHGVALGRVMVESGAVRPLAFELVRSATLDVGATGSRTLGSLGRIAPKVLPRWDYSPFIGVVVGDRVHLVGLLPDTDYVASRSIVLRSGPTGSVTVID